MCDNNKSADDGYGSRDGAVVIALASHKCGSGSIPGLDAICGFSLSLVHLSAPRGFSPGNPVFPSPQKPTLQIPIRSRFQLTNCHSVEVPLQIPILFYIDLHI